ncbi:MAG: 4a-hydroxytetrahydrobiopterin dehydratase [Alphaproteobacteria bacterium]|nr:4a-hydroxytetrahydrobiopterin dehydratase [Alphaproteobacteria bacterium]
MTEELAGKVCTPCQGGIPPLTAAEAEVFHKQTPKWDLTDDATWLRRSFGFDNFVGALDFVNKVGALAEEEGHHPDIALGWGYVDISIQTHKIKGLHENDFILAAKIDAIA